MIVNDKVDVLGIGITPTALAIAPLVTEAKKVTLVMSSGASITTTKCPYFVRAGFMLSQQSWILAEWAAKNGSSHVVTLVNDWAPGIEAETAFKTRFTQVGGDDRRVDPPAAGQSRLRAVPAAHRGSQARHRLHLFPRHPGAGLRQAIRRSGAWPNPASRSSARATSPTTTVSTAAGDQMLGMITAGALFGVAQFAAQQDLRRRHREGAASAGRLRLARRL